MISFQYQYYEQSLLCVDCGGSLLQIVEQPQQNPNAYGAWWLNGRLAALLLEGRRLESHAETLGKTFTCNCL